MLAAIALSPSAPVLVPELAGAAAAEVADLRVGAVRAARALPDRWIVVGAADAEQVISPDVSGTFAGYGAEVRISLAPDAPPEPRPLPLCALFAGWLRGQANPEARAEVHVVEAGLDAAAAISRGETLRTEIDRNEEPVGVLIVADGAATLTQAAPGGYDPGAPAVQAGLDTALACGDPAPLRTLPDGVVGRAAYQVLAGIAGGQRWHATEFAHGAPYGVGYFTGVWMP